MNWWLLGTVGGLALFFLMGIRVVQQQERGLKEQFGRYVQYCEPGFHWIIPFIDHIERVNITEQMVNAEKREIITKDKLNALVDAQVYFRVQATEQGVKASQYEVDNYTVQIVALAKTTLRNIIGNLTLTEANSDRQKINGELAAHLMKETSKWGIEIVRTELKEIDPPKDVQESMNNVVKAENQKVAAKDFAIAKETEADGMRMASIKIAEGQKQSAILEAQGRAAAIELVNNAAQTTFKDEAVQLRQLEVMERGLLSAAKIIIVPAGESVTGMLKGILAEKS